MGRSTTSSCFKIITCGSDSADNNDLDVVPESKGSNDKRGWSFRKRSARHRVLSNTVISETTSSVKKDSPESAELNFQPPNNSTIPEKISVVQCPDEKPQLSTPTDLNDSTFSEKISVVQCTNDKPQLSTTEDLKVPETIAPDDAESKPDYALDESVVIVIQGAVRGFLAQREFLKRKNVIKLQAAVRGHLVRRHAVGTLRCVQAIVKMQALVRARRARLSPSGSFTESKVDGKNEKDDHSSKTMGKGNSITSSNVSYSSIEKLLSNRFARQLLESTPKTKPIHIKCDPAKQDSAWNWLERWMSVSYAKQAVKPDSVVEQPENENNEKLGSPVDTRISSEVLCDSADSKSGVKETVVTPESEENLITYETDKFSFQPCQPTSSYRDDSEPSQPEDTSLSDVKEKSIEITSHQNQITSDAVSQTEPDSIPCKPEMESEQPKRSMKRFASENLEAEGKRFGFGSRKVSNPSFIATQSKFEELSLTTNSGKSVSSTNQDDLVDSNMDAISSGTDALTRTKEPSIAENSVPHCSRNLYGGSECGTELSISSTLDSPDIFEIATAEYEHEVKVSEKEICNPNTTNLDVKVDDASGIQVCDVVQTFVDQSEKVDKIKGESVDSVVTASPQVEHKPESSASDLHKELDSEARRQAYRSSPEASPRSHITAPESQGTPSSQVSIKAKKNKSEKSGSSRKRKPLSASKGSPSNPNHDSGARSSTEQLPRDQKSGKRRNSFGSTKTDDVDQEPRESNSSSSLPHFMQATESARAKLQANNSPRSSPDVLDREIYIKKRHSLPVANGRQGSPRIQRSMSQAQQVVKGNGTQPLHERKWQR